MKLNPLVMLILSAAATSTGESEEIWKRRQEAFFNYRPGHGGKSMERGPQHGRKDSAKGLRGMQPRRVIGRRNSFPTGGLTHTEQRREATRRALINQIGMERNFASPPQ